MKRTGTVRHLFSWFPEGAFSLEAWRQYAREISPELALLCEKDAEKYNFQKDVLPVVNSALAQKERLVRLEHLFEETEAELARRLPLLFPDYTEPELVLYLGLCSSAGRLARLEGKPVLLFGMEKILELGWDNPEDLKGLLFHETGHLWHDTRGTLSFPASSLREESLLQLWQEGIAMVCEQIFAGDESYYHEDKNGWLSWCQAHEALLKHTFLERMEKGESTQDFFGDWCSFQGVSDTGYYLGCQFIRFLLGTRSLEEAASLDFPVLMEEFRRFAGENGK